MGQRIISFTGAQSTGKTTLLKMMKENNNEKNYYFIDEVTRALDKDVFEINNTADNYNLTQSFIINSHLDNFYVQSSYLKEQDLILDRCIVDGYIYTYYMYENGKVSHNVLKFAEHWFREMISLYDFIFYTDPKDVELVDDGTRSTDIRFRNDIIELYDRYIFGQHYDNIHVISGSVEERMSNIEFLLEEKIPCSVCIKPTIYGTNHPEELEDKQNFQINGSHFCETCYNGAYNLI